MRLNALAFQTYKYMKGIVLAGDSGSRLYPLTIGVPKQLLPIYDKPMVFYPIELLRNVGIRDILLITTMEHQTAFKNCLGDGSLLGVTLSYAVQDYPRGIADAISIGAEFIASDDICLITGDTIILGSSLVPQLQKAFRAVKKKWQCHNFYL